MGQKKQSGLIGLYSGREIKTAATRSAGLTRTQTGKQALASIVSKYGSIVDNAKYFHKGKGEWRKYSLENDKKRTGSVTTDMNAWRRRPNKLDFQGIDTADGKKGSVKKAKQATSKSAHAKTKKSKFDSAEKKEANRITNTDIKRAAKLNEINVKIGELQKSIAFNESHGVTPVSDISSLKRLLKTRDKMLGIEPVKTDKQGKYVSSEEEKRKQAIDAAHRDWDNQAKAKLMRNVDFRDKSLKDCVNRHLKVAGF